MEGDKRWFGCLALRKVAEFIVGLNGGAQATFSGFRLYSDMLVPIPSMKVAIQGELGSFSHEAAEKLLPRARVVPCARSAEVFDRLEAGQVDAAIIPIENSLAGSVAEHFDLLLTRDVFIHREFPLRIRHNLIAPPGVKLGDLRRVFSHPVALDQCRNFFRAHPDVQSVPFYDTAGSVRHVVR